MVVTRTRRRKRKPKRTAPAFPQLRAALPLVGNDPPFDLGRSALADSLIPQESNVRRRGERLAHALRCAIQHLQPPHGTRPDDRRWLIYGVCQGEYLAGRTRYIVAEELAVSRSTYTRLKNLALARIADLLPTLLEDALARDVGGRS
jgi:hypothetical protein